MYRDGMETFETMVLSWWLISPYITLVPAASRLQRIFRSLVLIRWVPVCALWGYLRISGFLLCRTNPLLLLGIHLIFLDKLDILFQVITGSPVSFRALPCLWVTETLPHFPVSMDDPFSRVILIRGSPFTFPLFLSQYTWFIPFSIPASRGLYSFLPPRVNTFFYPYSDVVITSGHFIPLGSLSHYRSSYLFNLVTCPVTPH